MKRGAMRVIGLTGSIGMGKSTAASMLRRFGVPVYDADAAVHALYAKGGAAVGPVGAAFPGTVVDGAVDRAALSRLLVADRDGIRRLEAIVHPLARARQRRFLASAAVARRPIVVLDIPLLFETGGDRLCDGVMVVSAPEFLQRQRVLARHDMTAEKFALIRRRQMPDAEKRRRADVVIPSHRGFRPMALALRRALEQFTRPRRRRNSAVSAAPRRR
jgi:dephospho-CoA kinase